MREANLPNLKLVGTTSASGGRFGNVKITGEASLTGDVECRSLSCTGTADLRGSLTADTFKLTGECKVGGDMRSGRISAVGDIEIAGELHGDRVKLTGDVRVRGNGEAESIQVRGGLTVEGLLNAETIELRMLGPCRAKEIGGGAISVKRSRTSVFKMFTRGNAVLQADLIEGDILELEHTRAAVVRGNRVTLGPGCEIGRVEYRGDLSVHDRASVGERMKL